MAHLLVVDQLQASYASRRRVAFRPAPDVVPTVRQVSLEVDEGEIVAIAGDAGAGKTTLARALTLLIRPSRGRVLFEGVDLARQSDAALRPFRRRLQLLFTDPRTALNPQNLVSEAMLEPLRVHRQGTPAEQLAVAKHALRQVGLNSLLLDRKLSALSVGERQRIALARLLTLRPKLIICDDPARTLPPIVAINLFKLMDDIRQRDGLTFIWLVNQPQPAARFAQRLGILYQGLLVELGPTDSVLQSPQHPYTRRWLAGESPQPTPVAEPKICPYHHDCPHVMAICRERLPPLLATPTSQRAACFLYGGQ